MKGIFTCLKIPVAYKADLILEDKLIIEIKSPLLQFFKNRNISGYAMSRGEIEKPTIHLAIDSDDKTRY